MATLTCDCCSELPAKERVWHRAYQRWYVHDRAGQKLRAGLWGIIADGIARVIWP